MRQPKVLISIAILVVIALHIIPVVYAPERKTLWPILEWSMYKDARPAGPIQATQRRLTAVTSRGEEQPLNGAFLGSSGFAFEALYLRPMAMGDSSAAQALLVRLNRTRDEDPFVELRLRMKTFTVTDTGVVTAPRPVLSYRLDASRSGGGGRP